MNTKYHKNKSFLLLQTVTFISFVLLTGSVEAKEKSVATKDYCGLNVPVGSLDVATLIPKLYEIVSGKAGIQRDWPLLRTLMSPDSSITPVFHRNSPVPDIQKLTVDEFIELNKVLFRDVNFFETEISRTIHRFGHSATVISQYESRSELDAKPYARGVNSFQLVNDGRRWCVISATWDSDNVYHPIDEIIQ